jgi:hypothetical protein
MILFIKWKENQLVQATREVVASEVVLHLNISLPKTFTGTVLPLGTHCELSRHDIFEI